MLFFEYLCLYFFAKKRFFKKLNKPEANLQVNETPKNEKTCYISAAGLQDTFIRLPSDVRYFF